MRKRKRKFALELKNGEMVRRIEELREHFDLEKVIGYYKDGRLCEWLEGWFYENEAEAIQKISDQDENLAEQLCLILGVDSAEQEPSSINVEDVARNSDRLNRLRQYTNDPAILRHAPWTAFSQNDLEELLHAEQLPDTICLCPNTYRFSLDMLNKKNIHYLGIGKNVEAVILSKEAIVFESLGISFDNIRFDEAYEKLQDDLPNKWAEYGNFLYENRKEQAAFEWFLKAANAGNADAMRNVGYFYLGYLGEDEGERNDAIGVEWMEKAAFAGNIDAMREMAELYQRGEIVAQDYGKTLFWYTKAAENGDLSAMLWLGRMYVDGIGVKQNHGTALQWYHKIIETERDDHDSSDKESIAIAMYMIGWLHEKGKEGVDRDWNKAADWYYKAKEAGYADAKKGICRLALAEFAYKLHKIKRFDPDTFFTMKDMYFDYVSRYILYKDEKSPLAEFPTVKKFISEKQENVILCLESSVSLFSSTFGIIFTEGHLMIQMKSGKTHIYSYDDIISVKAASSSKITIEDENQTITFDLDEWPSQSIVIFLKVATRLDSLDSVEQSIVRGILIDALHGKSMLDVIEKYPHSSSDGIHVNVFDAFSDESFLL